MSNDPWRGPDRICHHCGITTEHRRCPVCKGVTEEPEADEHEATSSDWNSGFEHALTGALSADISDDYAEGYRAGEVARSKMLKDA